MIELACQRVHRRGAGGRGRCDFIVERGLRIADREPAHRGCRAGRAALAWCRFNDLDVLRCRDHRGLAGEVEADGGESSSPGRITPGSGPMTPRFASYHAGHAREMSTAVAPGPRCRAAISHSVSPRRTT